MPAKTRPAAMPEAPRPRGRPTVEDRAELEARLVRVARQAFVAHGYGAASMNEIARAARVSKTTLYARFPSKADMFRAIIDEQIRSAGGAAPWPSQPQPETLEAKLRAWGEHMTLVSLDPEVMQLNQLIYSEAARFPELAEAAWRRARIGAGQIAAMIGEHALKEGAPCKDAESVADAYILMLRGSYLDAILRSRTPEPAEVRAAVARFVELLLAARASW
jgi:AcrR family transcriptional regulator